jgi:hypothetical protein
MSAQFAPGATAREASFPERSRSRLVRAAHVGLRLIGLARVRLAFRRAQTALAASGAALAAAMLALTLAMQTGVEDATFAAAASTCSGPDRVAIRLELDEAEGLRAPGRIGELRRPAVGLRDVAVEAHAHAGTDLHLLCSFRMTAPQDRFVPVRRSS